MSQVKSELTTAEDYRRMPGETPRYQLIEGRLHLSPAPNRFHQKIVGRIYFLIQQYLEDHPVGEVYISPFDVYLTDINVFQPDVIYVTNSQTVILTDAGAEGPPDIAIEVLSKRTSSIDLGPKRKIYANTGVKELWILNPEAHTVDVYELQSDPQSPAATYSIAPSSRRLTTRIFP